MWYLSYLLLLLIIACLTALLGESVLLLIGLKGDRSGSERLALRWLTGSGVLILTAGWLSGCGGVMRGWGPGMTIVLALAALIVCHRDGGQTAGAPVFAVSSRNLLVLTALLAANISLWSLWRDNAFTPYNDYLSTIGQGEYLQDHSFRVPVNPGFGNPVRGIIYLFQVMGFRMGTHYLLALVQSWVPYARSVQVLPAVWAWGVWLCTAGVFLAARWLARIDRGPALLGCLIGAVNLGAPSFSAARGFMNQLYGVAIGLGVLATVSRAAGGTGRWRRRRSSSRPRAQDESGDVAHAPAILKPGSQGVMVTGSVALQPPWSENQALPSCTGSTLSRYLPAVGGSSTGFSISTA